MIKIAKHILIDALGEAEVPEDAVDWKYDEGYGTGRTYFSFTSEEGDRSLAKFCTILGSMAEAGGEEDFTLTEAMTLAENAVPIHRGRRSGWCFPGIEVV